VKTEEEKKQRAISRTLAWRAANMEKHKEYQKSYREKNKEKCKLAQRKYRKENIEYVREYDRNRRKSDSEKFIKRDMARYEKNKTLFLERKRAEYAENKDKYKVRNKVNYVKHNDKIKEYRIKNADKYASLARAWAKNHPERVKATNANRRAIKLQATPSWSEKELISRLYVEANKYGWHVDHVVPLRGKTVCGLHVHANLQVLESTENVSKGNRHWPDM